MRMLRSIAGIARSCRIYYGDRKRAHRMDALYRQFVLPGDLVFDVGAHVGDRTASFRRLGARVVALEPQPMAHGFLRLIYGLNRNVTVIQSAVGSQNGVLEFHLNLANPTISTGSTALMDAAKNAQGWEGQNWVEKREVPMTTLDSLIQRYGVPAFVKIDVEGFEAEVLRGLSAPLQALSFEFTTIQRDIALECITRLSALGPYRFTAALGESQSLAFPLPVSDEDMKKWLGELPHRANSGDIYAILDASDAAT